MLTVFYSRALPVGMDPYKVPVLGTAKWFCTKMCLTAEANVYWG